MSSQFEKALPADNGQVDLWDGLLKQANGLIYVVKARVVEYASEVYDYRERSIDLATSIQMDA